MLLYAAETLSIISKDEEKPRIFVRKVIRRLTLTSTNFITLHEILELQEYLKKKKERHNKKNNKPDI